jgi:hypothetical protein
MAPAQNVYIHVDRELLDPESQRPFRRKASIDPAPVDTKVAT